MDAVDDLSDSIDATRNFLTPVRAGLWLRLAIVAFFVGGIGTGFPSAPTGGGNPVGDQPPGTEQPVPDAGPADAPEEVLAAVAIVLGVILLLWLAFAFVSAVMEFVFIESLRSNKVRVRRYSNENVGRGIRLFGFRLFVGLAALLLGATPIVAAVLGLGGVEATAGIVAVAALFAVAVYLVYAVVTRFTSEFVAPIMLLEDRGVLGAWRRFWSTLGSNKAEYVVYLVLVWIIQAAVGIAFTILALVGGIVVAIPFAVLAVLLFTLGDIGAVLAAVAIVGAIVAFVLFAALVQVPIVSYFKYYALLLLGDTNAEFDLIPDQRAAIRTGGGDGPVGPGEEMPSDERRRRERDDRGREDDWTDDRDAEDDWTSDYGWSEEDDETNGRDDANRWDRDEDDERDDDRGW